MTIEHQILHMIKTHEGISHYKLHANMMVAVMSLTKSEFHNVLGKLIEDKKIVMLNYVVGNEDNPIKTIYFPENTSFSWRTKKLG